MECTLYDENLKIEARGTQEQMYSMVKHHVSNGMFLLRNFDSKDVLILYRDHGTVFPIASYSMMSPDIRLERCAEMGRKTIDEREFQPDQTGIRASLRLNGADKFLPA